MTVLLLGAAMVVLSVIIQSFFIALAIPAMPRLSTVLDYLPGFLHTVVLLCGLTLWLLFGITLALWCWAALFLFLGEFNDIKDAVYYSSVTATTLGYGDVLLSEKWELLSGVLAANGLVLFSLNTAFLFEALRRLEIEPRSP